MKPLLLKKENSSPKASAKFGDGIKSMSPSLTNNEELSQYEESIIYN